MAANYWNSTQRQFWFFSRDKLAGIRDETGEQHAKIIEQYPLPDRRHIFIYLKGLLLQLAKRLPFRQQCIATALVYMHRYFLFNPVANVNVYLLVATAFYLSSKTEESPHHIRLVASEARTAWPDFVPADVARIGEMEFSLISEMHSQLIIWHPYRTLLALKDDADLALSNDEINIAWSVINDSFLTDLPLICPPHVIALVAICLAVLFCPSRAALGLHPSLQIPGLSHNAASFSSLGGRPGLADALGNSMSNLSASQSTPSSSQGSTNGNRSPEDPTLAKDRALNPGAAPEKVQKIVKFLAESEVELEEMIQATQDIISLYEVWEQYNAQNVRESLAKYLKGRGLDA